MRPPFSPSRRLNALPCRLLATFASDAVTTRSFPLGAHCTWGFRDEEGEGRKQPEGAEAAQPAARQPQPQNAGADAPRSPEVRPPPSHFTLFRPPPPDPQNISLVR